MKCAHTSRTKRYVITEVECIIFLLCAMLGLQEAFGTEYFGLVIRVCGVSQYAMDRILFRVNEPGSWKIPSVKHIDQWSEQ